MPSSSTVPECDPDACSLNTWSVVVLGWLSRAVAVTLTEVLFLLLQASFSSRLFVGVVCSLPGCLGEGFVDCQLLGVGGTVTCIST